MNPKLVPLIQHLIRSFLFFLLVFSISCSEPCDGDSFYEWSSINYKINNRSNIDFFTAYPHPDYDIDAVEICDEEGNEYNFGHIDFFPNWDNTNRELVESLNHPITKIYYIHFNEFDQDTLKIIIKGTHSDPCHYQIMEYYKVYYNDKVVFYDLYPRNSTNNDDPIVFYKEL